jgi:hypothetical protein
MNLELHIPEEVAHLLTSEFADLPRAALEALALEGYRSKRFSEGQVRQMLGFSSRLQVHAFLKEHGVHLHYSLTIWSRIARPHGNSKTRLWEVHALHDCCRRHLSAQLSRTDRAH